MFSGVTSSVATKIENGRIWRFFGVWKWTEDQYEESLLIQKYFEDLQRLLRLQRSSKLQRFSKENEKFLLLKFSFRHQLKQIFPAVELNTMWGNWSSKF